MTMLSKEKAMKVRGETLTRLPYIVREYIGKDLKGMPFQKLLTAPLFIKIYCAFAKENKENISSMTHKDFLQAQRDGYYPFKEDIESELKLQWEAAQIRRKKHGEVN